MPVYWPFLSSSSTGYFVVVIVIGVYEQINDDDDKRRAFLSSLPGNESLKTVERIVSSSTSALNVSMLTQALRGSPNVIGIMCSSSATYYVTNRNPFPKPNS